MRADRLLSILMLLQTRGRMTAQDLAERLEVSVRTIYRDLEALGSAGVPVYAERGPGGGCMLLDDYRTDLTGLTGIQVRALFLNAVMSPLEDLGLGQALDEALLKLAAALPQEQRDEAEIVRQRVYVDAALWPGCRETSACLPAIQEALWQDRRLRVVCAANDGALNEQIIEPYGLVAKAGAWYLVGMASGARCICPVASLRAVSLTEELFTRRADFDLVRCWADYCRQMEADKQPSEISLAPLHSENIAPLQRADKSASLPYNSPSPRQDTQPGRSRSRSVHTARPRGGNSHVLHQSRRVGSRSTKKIENEIACREKKSHKKNKNSPCCRVVGTYCLAGLPSIPLPGSLSRRASLPCL